MKIRQSTRHRDLQFCSRVIWTHHRTTCVAEGPRVQVNIGDLPIWPGAPFLRLISALYIRIRVLGMAVIGRLTYLKEVVQSHFFASSPSRVL